MLVDSNLGARPVTPVIKAGKSYPVMEIFGPVCQGEGRYIGMACHFVRFGGCSYRCVWCDTKFAVDPAEVKANAISMTPQMIMQRLNSLNGNPDLIVLSGGDPVLHNLAPIIDELHSAGKRIAVETQGAKWKSWLDTVDLQTVSPKPPSSGMVTNWDMLDRVMTSKAAAIDIKVVAFDDLDLEYARTVFTRYPADGDRIRHFVSTGTFVGESTRDDILDRMRDFIEMGLKDPVLCRVTYGCQLHVLLHGHKRGV